ncbi:ENTH domain-containing protein 1 isoform X2 [Mus caroli]|uniref:ENTH domain-containing protein 1 isoform X2 n=1 Tax=Mus caroli TaxID=10089 RepID=A0A6P5R470_MUSCR|nr:ENTH domain-containing protein 1 isoform X2 [Mus caroli]
MSFRRQVKNFVKNYSEAEKKVREATSNDPWGPSSSLMLAISDMTFNAASLSEIMHMLWQRLSDHGKNWRHVYKSLALMDYLIKNGSRKVIQYCREGVCNLQTLKDFQHIDEAGKDQGHYIRERSKQVITLLMDEQLLYKEREVATWTRQRTSYSMSFPSRLSATGTSHTVCTSVLIPESLTSEKKHSQDCKKTAGLCNKKSTSKARLRLEQCQDVPSPAGTSLPLYFPSLGMKAWKSTEDLTLLYSYEHPKQPVTRLPPSFTSPASWLSEGETEICNLWDTVSATSEVTSSFSTLSISPPDLAHPEKSARCFIPVMASSSFWTLPQPQSPSDPFTDQNEAVRVRHPFAPTSTASSDDEECPTLPDNSDSTMKEPSYSFSSGRGAFSTLTRAPFPGLPQASFRFQESAGLSRDSESRAIRTLLGEVKSAVVQLHHDLSLVIQELGVINNHLGNLSGSSPTVSETLQDPQSPRGSPDPI